MEEDVSRWEGLAVGIIGVRRRERSLIVGVGDNAQTGGYGLRTGSGVHVLHII